MSQCQKKYKNKYTQRKIKSNTNCSKKRVPIPLPRNYEGVSQSPVQPFGPVISGSDRSLQAGAVARVCASRQPPRAGRPSSRLWGSALHRDAREPRAEYLLCGPERLSGSCHMASWLLNQWLWGTETRCEVINETPLIIKAAKGTFPFSH